MQNYFIESIYLTIRKDSIYTKALREIDTIITMIDNELNLNSE